MKDMCWLLSMILIVMFFPIFAVFSEEILGFFGRISGKISKSFENKKKIEDKKLYVDRMTRVKVLSNDIGDIENFIKENAVFLTEASMDKLVSRLELLQADHAIEASNRLRFPSDKLITKEEMSSIRENATALEMNNKKEL